MVSRIANIGRYFKGFGKNVSLHYTSLHLLEN